MPSVIPARMEIEIVPAHTKSSDFKSCFMLILNIWMQILLPHPRPLWFALLDCRSRTRLVLYISIMLRRSIENIIQIYQSLKGATNRLRWKYTRYASIFFTLGDNNLDSSPVQKIHKAGRKHRKVTGSQRYTLDYFLESSRFYFISQIKLEVMLFPYCSHKAQIQTYRIYMITGILKLNAKVPLPISNFLCSKHQSFIWIWMPALFTAWNAIQARPFSCDVTANWKGKGFEYFHSRIRVWKSGHKENRGLKKYPETVVGKCWPSSKWLMN
jgi:hypothetical protein